MHTPPPSPHDQIRFLQNLQRILSEGRFVSTYKFALLRSLADLAVLQGHDHGGPLTLTVEDIAEQFITLYWNHANPFPLSSPTDDPITLKQNSGRQAKILNDIQTHKRLHSTLTKLRTNKPLWTSLVKSTARVIKQQPLWRLQTIGTTSHDFLYETTQRGSTITLLPGVSYCLRTFYNLTNDLICAAWTRHIRQLNSPLLGQHTDLASFLFGSQRNSLQPYTAFLRDLQNNTCFYCQTPLRSSTTPQVDHFIPWSIYPLDLGHNFVLAHPTCNTHKSNHIAALPHLRRWSERNQHYTKTLHSFFQSNNLPHDLPSSLHIARWAYQNVQHTNALVWTRKHSLVPLDRSWESVLSFCILI